MGMDLIETRACRDETFVFLFDRVMCHWRLTIKRHETAIICVLNSAGLPVILESICWARCHEVVKHDSELSFVIEDIHLEFYLVFLN